MTQRRSVPGSRTRGPDDAGVVAVEFALVVPLLIVLLFTIILGGSVWLDQMHLQSAARNAARAGAVAPASACDAATTELSDDDVGAVTCTLINDCTSGSARIQLTAQQTIDLPLVGERNVTLNASSSFVCS